LPHAPQLFESLPVLAQLPLHSVDPAAQAQVPPAQD
jgi:hypothetical protein